MIDLGDTVFLSTQDHITGLMNKNEQASINLMPPYPQVLQELAECV